MSRETKTYDVHRPCDSLGLASLEESDGIDTSFDGGGTLVL